MEGVPALELRDLTRRFGDRAVVSRVSLEIPKGRLLALLGPSGCGKTTTLRIVAGHERPDSGRVLLDGEDVTDRPPERRDVGMVFQSYALFPHLSVYGNVAFGLRSRKVKRDEERTRVAEALRTVGLEGSGPRPVTSLSGGEQQRVALARALVLRPRVLLLDEPLSNLDAALRVATRREIRRIQREAALTTLYVTHDQEEAMAIADRVVVMEGGRVRQSGAPEEVYARPSDAFTASFLGDANVLTGVVKDGALVAGDGLTLPAEGLGPEGSEATVAVRRESIRLVPGDSARVTERQFLGETWLVAVSASGVVLRVRHPAGAVAPPGVGEAVGIEIPEGSARVLEEREG
ncbi:MAG: ABC transporter ATP-binding protein [Planctomycetota bacterium]|jgi:putative spermidine/putrescine transport system ATP-binding protein